MTRAVVRAAAVTSKQLCAGWWAFLALAIALWLVAPAAAQEDAGAEGIEELDEAIAEDEEHADDEEHEEDHYPLKVPERHNWTFDGPFGTYDPEQLQRGLQVYREVCAACHGLERVAFRTLSSEIGPYLSEEEMREIAASYRIVDAETGDVREGRPADYFPASNIPTAPDLSLMTKARAVGDGFRWLLDPFIQYQAGGADYMRALLVGYEPAPEDKEIQPGLFYNPYFVSGIALSMPPPLFDGRVSYDDGSPETVEQYSEDVSAFLMWTAEPKLTDRKRIGFQVMIFLLVFAVLAYLAKRRVWSKEH